MLRYRYLCPSLTSYPEAAHRPKISVIVPARNEEACIYACIHSIVQQDYGDMEVILANDGSSDNTSAQAQRAAQTARHVDFREMAIPELRKGWKGKPNALDFAVQQTQGELLLFVDADVVMHKEALAKSVDSLLAEEANFLCLWLRHHNHKTSQYTLHFFVIWMQMLSSTLLLFFSKQRFPRAGFGYGPFLLVQRNAYEEVGGPRAVYKETSEDHQLFLRFQDRGFKPIMPKAGGLVQVTMYSSLPEIWRGWGKNLVDGFPSVMGLVEVAALTVLLLFWSPIAIMILSEQHVVWRGLSLLNICLIIYAQSLSREEIKQPLYSYALYPISATMYACLLLFAKASRLLNISLAWKGRQL